MAANIAAIFFSFAAKPNISFIGCSPTDGSTVSNWEFDLQFDLSKVYQEYGYDENFGMCIGGNNIYGIKLYQGYNQSGVLVQSLYNYAVIGTHDEFQTGNIIHCVFDKSKIISGKPYALVVDAIITCRKKGESSGTYSKSLDYTEAPLILNFIADDSGEINFGILNDSLDENLTLTNIPAIQIEFTKTIQLNENAKASLFLTSPVHRLLKEVGPSLLNDKIIEINFGDYPLYKGWEYKVVLESESVSDMENPDNKSVEFSKILLGNTQEYFTAESIEPVYDEHGCVEAVAITWNSPNPDQSNIQHSLLTEAGWTMVVETDDEGKTGSALRAGDGWPVSSHPLNYSGLKPSRTYYFHLDEGKIMGYLDGIYYCPGLLNREINLQFETPSIESTNGIAPAEYNYVGIYNPETINELMPIDDGYQSDYLGNVEVEIKDYTNEGKKWNLVVEPYAKGQFFEITPEGDKLIKEYRLKKERRGNNGLYLKNTVVSPINYQLEKDKTYKMVIPKNCLYVDQSLCPPYEYYIQSPALEFTFKGSDNLTGIREIEDSHLKVFPEDNNIVFEGLSEGSNVSITTPEGIMIATFEASDSTALLEVSTGIYIVTVDGKSTKVIIR